MYNSRVTSKIICYYQKICLNYFIRLRITDEGSVPEISIWSILLIKSDLKWCIHLSRCLFYIRNVRAIVQGKDGLCIQFLRDVVFELTAVSSISDEALRIDPIEK